MSTRRFLRQLFVVFRKELRDSVRDRRAILAIVFGVLVGPAVIAVMVNRIAERQRSAEEVEIPIVGAAHAPALVDWLRRQWGVTVVEGPSDPERAVRDGTIDLVLVLPDDFAERFRQSRAAPVAVVSDSSRESTVPQVRRVKNLLGGYNAEMAALRLIAHGVSPQVASALRIDEVEVSTPQQRASPILNFLGLFLILSALTGGMQLATDSTAGERERGSLEPLLVNPVARGALAGGKVLAASAASLVAVALTAAFCIGLLHVVLGPDMGIRVHVGGAQLITIAIAALSMCPLAAAMQAFVGTFSRSFKEAQSYIGVLMTVPVMTIGVVGALYPIKNQLWMYGVPLLAQYTLVTSVFGGTEPGIAAYILTTASSLVVAVALVALITRLLRSERIIFGR